MASVADRGGDRPLGGLTAELAGVAAAIRFNSLPPDVVEVARLCLLDWLGVTIAGAHHPAAELIFRVAAANGAGSGSGAVSSGGAAVVGRAARLGCLDAALANGTASHALEYDDSIVRMQAHPSAALLPGLVALAETRGLPPAHVLAALVAGVECGCRLGDEVNPGHYARGWHASATLGAVAAAVACGNLLGLDERALRSSLGLAAVQAAGLKAAFGSVAKPFQVGRAAAAGLLAALLAEQGAEVPDRVVDGADGFVGVYADAAAIGAKPRRRGLPTRSDDYAIGSVLFKRHASCHGTHATLTAIGEIRAAGGDLDPGAIAAVLVDVPEQLRSVCGIDRPADGSELRFSLRGLAAMALAGFDTADPAAFADGVLREPAYCALLERIEVRYVPGLGDFGGEARVEIRRREAPPLVAETDIAVPERDLARQERELRRKFERLVRPLLGAARTGLLLDAVAGFESLGSVSELTDLCRPDETSSGAPAL